MQKSEAPGADCAIQGFAGCVATDHVEHGYIYATPRGELSAGEEHRVSSLQALLISGGQVHKG